MTFLRALRPLQWTKNLFVLAPVLFALADRRPGAAPDGPAVGRALLAFVAFCLASSATYLANDVRDVERDRLHPQKRFRPIASGALSVRVALVAAALFAVLALLIALAADGSPYPVAVVLALYLAINVAYSLGLKDVVLVDAFCIAGGFILRVAAGGTAAHAEVSRWMFLCTLFLALFLALNKRRAELILLGEESASHRANLRDYTRELLDQMVGIVAACTIVCYAMYTIGDETAQKFGEHHHLLWSVPFVVFGIARYAFLVQTGRGGGSPERVLLGGDLWFALNLVAWAAVVAFALADPFAGA
jgi:4-hydroxybenzoate polyprenyltransferase